LAACTVAASFSGVNFAAVGQQPVKRLDVFVVNEFVASPAEAALRPLTNVRYGGPVSAFSTISTISSFVISRFHFYSFNQLFLT
jgi:hypothetical protein